MNNVKFLIEDEVTKCKDYMIEELLNERNVKFNLFYYLTPISKIIFTYFLCFHILFFIIFCFIRMEFIFFLTLILGFGVITFILFAIYDYIDERFIYIEMLKGMQLSDNVFKKYLSDIHVNYIQTIDLFYSLMNYPENIIKVVNNSHLKFLKITIKENNKIVKKYINYNQISYDKTIYEDIVEWTPMGIIYKKYKE